MPALLGLKGNLEMTLASRLSTQVSAKRCLAARLCSCLCVQVRVSPMLFRVVLLCDHSNSYNRSMIVSLLFVVVSSQILLMLHCLVFQLQQVFDSSPRSIEV